MTQNVVADQGLTIPAEGLTHTAGDVKLRVMPTAQCGYQIQGRRNGVHAPELSSTHTFETQALTAWADLIAQHPAQDAPKLAPAAKGTQTQVSDPGHTALAVAELNGFIARGGQPGQASVTLINSLAKRGYLKRTTEMQGLRQVVTGATITHAGRIRLGQLTAEDREAARIAAAVARPASAAQLINA